MAEAVGEFNNSIYAILDIDRRFHFITADTTPAELALMQQVGPILKLFLRINKSIQLQLINLYGDPWESNPTRPNTVGNRHVQFPLTRATTCLTNILSSVIPPAPDLIKEVVLKISNYAALSTNPTDIAAAGVNIIRVVVDLTVVFVIRPPPARPWLAQTVRDWVRDSGPIVIVRERREMILEMDLKERYGFCLSGAADDNVGDCAVCLEEVAVVETTNKSMMDSNVLKMPCSHVFHCQCIIKWLKMRDSCPLCRSIIP